MHAGRCTPAGRTTAGGGLLEEEGEHIEVLELDVDEALAGITSGTVTGAGGAAVGDLGAPPTTAGRTG